MDRTGPNWNEWTELGSGQYMTNVDRIGSIWTKLTELDRCGLNKTDWADLDRIGL